ncbi:hypothetical protein TcCL_NonESM06650 [Trypanosoma cruzi]|nr:hypothetical protein TcCL_NonESM06650 [Trypanosoma cruzi]
MAEGPLSRVAGVVAAVFLPFPVGCGNELGDGGGCVLLLHGGWLLALCAFLAWMPSRGVWTVRLGLLPSPHVVCSLSLCIGCALCPSPSRSILAFPFRLTDQLTGSSDSTTRDDGAVCAVLVLVLLLAPCA